MLEAAAPVVLDVSVDEGSVELGAETSAMPLPPERPQKPNKQSHDSRVNLLLGTIKERQKRNKEIKSIIDRSRKEEETITEEKSKVHTDIRSVRKEKDEAKGPFDRLDEMRATLKKQILDMKKQNPVIDSPAKIQAQIIRFQNKQNHTSMPLDEEKKLVAQIDKWKALRDTAATYAERIETLKGIESEWKPASNKLKRLDEKLRTLNARMSALYEDLTMARAKTQAHISALRPEMENNRGIINKADETIEELKRNWQAENLIYWEANQDYKAWCEWDKKKREEAKSQEEAEMHALNLLDEEVGYCDQLTTYLSKFLAADAKVTALGDAPHTQGPETLDGSVKCAPTANGPGTPPDGCKVLKPNDDDVEVERDYSLSNGKKKVTKKNKKGAGRKADQPAEQKLAEQKLVHSIDNINVFAKLNIELPLTASKVPATLEVIKARKEHYLAERARGKKKSTEVTQDTSVDNADLANGHAMLGSPGTTKGAATAEVSAESDQVPAIKETAPSMAQAVDPCLKVEGQGYPTLDVAREKGPERKGYKRYIKPAATMGL